MRLGMRLLGSFSVALLAAVALAACQSSDLPMPANGPNGQSFSTNNTLVRFLQGSPDVATPVDVYVDGSLVFSGVSFGQVVPRNPPNFTGGYVSVPAGQVLVVVYTHVGHALVIPPFVYSAKAGDKFDVALVGRAAAVPSRFQMLAIKEAHFNNLSINGIFGLAFDEASPNASAGGPVALNYNCNSCNPGITAGVAGLGQSMPVTYAPPANGYTFTANGSNTVGPIPLGIPGIGLNLTVFEFDAGAATSTIIGVIDPNG